MIRVLTSTISSNWWSGRLHRAKVRIHVCIKLQKILRWYLLEKLTGSRMKYISLDTKKSVKTKSLIYVYPFSIPGKFHPGTRQFFWQQVPSTIHDLSISIFLHIIGGYDIMRDLSVIHKTWPSWGKDFVKIKNLSLRIPQSRIYPHHLTPGFVVWGWVLKNCLSNANLSSPRKPLPPFLFHDVGLECGDLRCIPEGYRHILMVLTMKGILKYTIVCKVQNC